MDLKKVCLFFIGMFTCLLEGYAESNVDFICPSETMIGNKISCTLKLGGVEEVIKGVQVRYQSSDVFSYLDTNAIQPWSIITANSLGMIAVHVDEVNQVGDVVQTNFMISRKAEIGKSYDIKLTDIKLSDGEKDIEIPEKSYPIKVLSVHDIVDKLEVNGVPLELQDGVDSYTVEVDRDRVEIVSVLKKDNYQFMDGYGSRIIENLSLGKNQALLKIMADQQELLTFTLNIQRVDNQIQDEGELENPKTGNFYVIGIMVILLISLGVLYYYNRVLKRGRSL